MNYRRLKKVYIFLIVLAVMLFGSLTAQAATPKIAKTKMVYAEYDGSFKTYDFDGYIKINGMKAGDKIISVKASGLKSSDKLYFDVLQQTTKTVRYTYYRNQAISISGNLKSKNAGSFKMLLKVRRGKKIYASTCTVKVQDKPYLFSEIRIDGKKYVGKVRNVWDCYKYSSYHSDISAGKKKITIKTMPGTKVKHIMINELEDNGDWTPHFCTQINNNGSFTFEAGKSYTLIIFYSCNNAFIADAGSNSGDFHLGISVKRNSGQESKKPDSSEATPKTPKKTLSSSDVLLIGSSSMYLWKTASTVLAPYQVVNLAIPASSAKGWKSFAPSVIKGYLPKAVIVYVGVNDAGANNSAIVYANVTATLSVIHKTVPKAKIFFISIIPTYAKKKAWNTIRTVNTRLQGYCDAKNWSEYIDVASTVAPKGTPITKYFRSDNQHMNDAGYAVWNSIVPRKVLSHLKKLL